MLHGKKNQKKQRKNKCDHTGPLMHMGSAYYKCYECGAVIDKCTVTGRKIDYGDEPYEKDEIWCWGD